MIEIKNASFKYANGFQALENINLTIKEGEKVAIVGQNGAGKTTCVKMMNGLNRPFEGDVIVDGINTKEMTYKPEDLINELSVYNKIYAYIYKDKLKGNIKTTIVDYRSFVI